MLRRRQKGDADADLISNESYSEPEKPKQRRLCATCFKVFNTFCLTGFITALVFVVALVLIYSFAPCPIEPQFYELPEPPAFTGPLAPNLILTNAEKRMENTVKGPESISLHHNGNLYTGLSDGRVVELSTKLREVTREVKLGKDPCGTFDDEPNCGRPLGLKFNDRNEIIVADAYLGLYKINIWQGKSEQLIEGGRLVDGRPLKFLNDVEVVNDTIYFTDSSSTWGRRHHINLFLEAKPDGRLLSYNVHSKLLKVLLDGLYFPNGVQLAFDGKSLLVSETTRARIIKYHIDGPKTGASEIFADNLPGFPDNLRLSSNGSLWVPMAFTRQKDRLSIFDFLGPRPWIRRLISQLVSVQQIAAFRQCCIPEYGLVVLLDQKGRLTGSLHDPTGKTIPSVSEVVDAGSVLFLGSFHANFIGKVKL